MIAPNKSLSVVDGHLNVSDVIGFEARRAPVDIFFRTLAEAKDAHAVCVVLSGTGPNGSMGLQCVKERGGIAIAQDPREAEFSDMPLNAVATGLIDYVLPVREIPTKIQSYQARLHRLPLPGPSDEHPSDEQIVREILAAVRAQTGHDFVQYKRGTILRRMHRRMSVHELPDVGPIGSTSGPIRRRRPPCFAISSSASRIFSAIPKRGPRSKQRSVRGSSRAGARTT